MSDRRVLVLPANGMAADVYDGLGVALARVGCTMHAVTYPGFDGTPPLANPSWDALADGCRPHVEALGEGVLVGHSLGGLLAAKLAPAFPMRALVLFEPAINPVRPLGPLLARRTDPLREPCARLRSRGASRGLRWAPASPDPRDRRAHRPLHLARAGRGVRCAAGGLAPGLSGDPGSGSRLRLADARCAACAGAAVPGIAGHASRVRAVDGGRSRARIPSTVKGHGTAEDSEVPAVWKGGP